MSEKVEFNCPHCQQLYRVDEAQLARLGGKPHTCRKCQQSFTFPTLEDAPTPHVAQSEPKAAPVPPPAPAPQRPVSPLAATPATDPAWTQPAPQAAPAPQAHAPAPAAGPIGYLPQPRPKSPFSLVDMITFRTMVTPIVIQALFWIGVAVCVIMGIGSIVGAFALGSSQTRVNGRLVETSGVNLVFLITGIGQLFVGPIIVRVYCEILIVIFKIHQRLNDIHGVLERRG